MYIIEKDPRIPIKQAMPEKGSLSHPGHHCSPESPPSSLRGASTPSHLIALLFHLSKPLQTGSSSSGCRHSLELCRRQWRHFRIFQQGKRVDSSAKSHAAFSALLPLSAGADRGKRAGSQEGVAPSGRHGLDLRKGCWKGQRLLKLCRKGQSLPKLCQKGQTCVERVGERGRKVTPKIRINVHKPLHWSINDQNRYIHAHNVKALQGLGMLDVSMALRVQGSVSSMVRWLR